MPLEIIIDFLLNENKSLRIYLPICSSGSFSTLIIYSNKIYPLKAFGKKLINKYVYKQFVNPRIKQEKSIGKNLDDLKIKYFEDSNL